MKAHGVLLGFLPQSNAMRQLIELRKLQEMFLLVAVKKRSNTRKKVYNDFMTDARPLKRLELIDLKHPLAKFKLNNLVIILSIDSTNSG